MKVARARHCERSAVLVWIGVACRWGDFLCEFMHGSGRFTD